MNLRAPIKRNPPFGLDKSNYQRWHRECARKAMYTLSEANAALANVNARYGDQRAYRCSFEDHWHLTSKPRRAS